MVKGGSRFVMGVRQANRWTLDSPETCDCCAFVIVSEG
jgi:hypothetical protein